MNDILLPFLIALDQQVRTLFSVAIDPTRGYENVSYYLTFRFSSTQTFTFPAVVAPANTKVNDQHQE